MRLLLCASVGLQCTHWLLFSGCGFSRPGRWLFVWFSPTSCSQPSFGFSGCQLPPRPNHCHVKISSLLAALRPKVSRFVKDSANMCSGLAAAQLESYISFSVPCWILSMKTMMCLCNWMVKKAWRTRSGDEQHCHCEHRQCVGSGGGDRSRAANGGGEVISWSGGVTFGDSRGCGCGCEQVAVVVGLCGGRGPKLFDFWHVLTRLFRHWTWTTHSVTVGCGRCWASGA
eukprot:6107820-Amphidinium_carterae.1